MAGLPGERLRPRERLTSGAQYRRVFRRGVRVDGPLFLLIAADNECGHDRLGLAASRKVGDAVIRNRAKRLLRESFRRNKRPQPRALDMVLVPKREIAQRSQGEVEGEYRERLRRLEARVHSQPRRPVAPARN